MISLNIYAELTTEEKCQSRVEEKFSGEGKKRW